MRRNYEILISWAPRVSVVAMSLLTFLIGVDLLADIMTGRITKTVLGALVLGVAVHFLYVSIRGRRRNREAIRLRRKIVHVVKKRLAGRHEISLLARTEQTAVHCRRRGLPGMRWYLVATGTDDAAESTDSDWNLEFNRQGDLVKYQDFTFRPMLDCVERYMLLVSSEDDIPENTESSLSPKYVAERMNLLSMGAIAEADELRWLLRVLRKAEPAPEISLGDFR